MMDVVLKMMDSVLKMMDFVLKMMDLVEVLHHTTQHRPDRSSTNCNIHANMKLSFLYELPYKCQLFPIENTEMTENLP